MGILSARTFQWSRVKHSSESVAPCPLVVMLGWMQSQEKHLQAYLDLYNSEGWDGFAVAPPTLFMWLDRYAESLAREVLDVVSAEIHKSGDRPIVFAIFSGSAKACYYKLLQVLGSSTKDEKYATVRKNLCGQCFDSCPIDFVSQHGVRFLAPPKTSSWIQQRLAGTAASVLDSVLLSRFERERKEFWEVLTQPNAIPRNAPTVLLFSEDDDLAPASVIKTFSGQLMSTGWRVQGLCWPRSEHVGHLRQHPKEYRAAVSAWLEKAVEVWREMHPKLLAAHPISIAKL